MLAAQTRTTTSDTTPAATASAQAAQGASGGFDLAGFLSFGSPVAPVPGAPPEVLAIAGTTIAGDGEFEYLVIPDGTFEVVAMPPGTPPEVMGRPIRPDNEYAKSWRVLCDQVVAQARSAPEAPAAEPEPAAPAVGPMAPAAPAAPGAGTIFLDGIAAIGNALLSPIETAGELLSSAEQLFAELTGFGDEEVAEQPDGAPRAPGEPAVAPAGPIAIPGVEDNLKVAEQLAHDTEMPHLQDGRVAGDNVDDGGARRAAILDGDTDAMKTILCSEFTTMSLAKAGFDLEQDYRHPGQDLPAEQQNLAIGYPETSGAITFVTMYDVSNNLREALGALVAVQSGDRTLCKAGSPQAKALKSGCNKKFSTSDKDDPDRKVLWEVPGPAERSEDFWIAGSHAATDLELADGDMFGAGAVAVALGGTRVEQVDRRPGDVQQRMDIVDGKTAAAVDQLSGHSATVYAVRGGGVCLLDGSGDPKLIDASGKPIEVSATGWYSADGKTRLWEVGPDADPARVASLTVTSVQLLDANRARDNARGDDATGVGGFKPATAFSAEGASSVTSTGRLPNSRWNAAAGAPADVKPAP